MDQNLLLTIERLSLNPDIQKGHVSHGTLVIKNVPAHTYLRVSKAQAAVLHAFVEPSTVPEAFARMLKSRDCLPLREFYELVVKAHQAGILCGEGFKKPVRPTISWPGFSGGFLLWPALALAAGVLLWLLIRAPFLPPDGTALGIGAVAALVMLSLGQMLAASLLAGMGWAVYPVGWLALLARLHLRFDLRDSQMLPPGDRALIALAGTLPLSMGLLLAMWFVPHTALPMAVVWLLVWRPWGMGVPRRLTELINRYPHLDTDSGFLFLPNLRPQRHWRPWRQRWDWRVWGLELIWAVGWSVLVARLALDLLGLGLADVLADRGYWAVSLRVLCASLLITAMIIMVKRWRDGLRQAGRELRQKWARSWCHWRREYVFPDNQPALLRLAAAHPLLGLLNPYEQNEVLRACRPERFAAWKTVIKSDKESDRLGWILSGRASATRVGRNGRRLQALALEDGDFFGLPQLRQGAVDILMEVRTRTPVAAMMMPTDVFKKMILARLGGAAVYDLTYKYAFLKMLPLCRHWHVHAVARFARIAQIAVHSDGERVMREKCESGWFYIVYDGIAQVQSNGRLLNRLKSGDFFGEISLLQNGVSTADVIAQGQLRCLQIDRASFLRFMTHNHHVALRLEKISSQRLGYPIFPMTQAAF